MDFATLLSDTTKYPDTLEIPVGEEKVSLGTLRSTVKAAQQAAAEQKAAYEQEFGKARQLALDAAALVTKLQQPAEVKPQVDPPKTNAEDFYESDPYYEPIRKRLTPLEKQIAGVIDQMKAQAAAVEKAAVIFARDRWDRQYSQVSDRLKGDKYKEYRNVEKLAQYATDRQLVDQFGLPSIERAVQDLTKEDEIDRIKREAYEDGLKKGKVEARMANMQRPTSAVGAGKKPEKGLDPTKNFEDLGDTVAEDAELMAMIAQVGNLDPGSLQ